MSIGAKVLKLAQCVSGVRVQRQRPIRVTKSPAMASSIPRPSSPWVVPPTPLRPLLPIFPPTLPLLLPVLPSPQRVPHIHPSFALSTHFVQATHIRSTPHVPLPPPSLMPVPPSGTGKKPSKEERIRKATAVRTWLSEARQKEADDSAGYKRILWNCVNRYYRIDSGRRRTQGRGLTLFIAHANGFPKEVCKYVALVKYSRLTRIRARAAPDLGADVKVPPCLLC